MPGDWNPDTYATRTCVRRFSPWSWGGDTTNTIMGVTFPIIGE